MAKQEDAKKKDDVKQAPKDEPKKASNDEPKQAPKDEPKKAAKVYKTNDPKEAADYFKQGMLVRKTSDGYVAHPQHALPKEIMKVMGEVAPELKSTE